MTAGNQDHNLEIRRTAWVPLAIGFGAAAMAVAFLMRVLDGQWQSIFVAVPMSALAVACAWSLWDGHVPVLIADDHGIRVREGSGWRGLPWGEVAGVQVHASRTIATDGSLVIVPAAGGQITIGVGLVTGHTPAGQGRLAGRLVALARGRAVVARQADPVAPAARRGFTTPKLVAEVAAGVAAGVTRAVRALPLGRAGSQTSAAIAAESVVGGTAGGAIDDAPVSTPGAATDDLQLELDLEPHALVAPEGTSAGGAEHTSELPELDDLRRPPFGDGLDAELELDLERDADAVRRLDPGYGEKRAG